MTESERDAPEPTPTEPEATGRPEGSPAHDERTHPAYRLEPGDDEADPQPPTD